MRRCISQQWLQFIAVSQGASSCGSGWLGAGRRLDSWRGMSGQQAGGALSPRRIGQAEQLTEPSKYRARAAREAGAAPALGHPLQQQKQKPLRAGVLLERFLGSFDTTPPATFMRSVGVPTAMSWMRRRGPEVPHAVLYRLFRQRQIRLFDGETVRRVSASRPLDLGDLLLYPSWLASNKQQQQLQNRLRNQQQQQQQQHRASRELAGQDTAARAAALLAAAAAVRRADHHHHSSNDGGGDDDDAREGAVDGDVGGGRLFGSPPAQAQAAAAAAAATAATGLSSLRRRGIMDLTPERVRRWVLGVHPGLLFLNKPAGVTVHGMAKGDEPRGGGMRPPVPVSLNDVMQEALRFGQGDEPRLVHRLDQAASGVMVVARNADAATWLCAAFKDKAQQALAGDRRGEGEDKAGKRNEDDDFGGPGAPGGHAGRPEVLRGERAEERPSIRRTYWAFLAGDLQPRQSGRISIPVVVDGVACPAVTSYRVKATGCGVSWVELTPETGRRHQLRVHCARKLGAPIIGDERYGYRGLPPRLMLRDRLPPEWWALLGEDPRVVRRSREAAGEAGAQPAPVLLHSRELVVKRPRKALLAGVAPLPRYIRQLIEAAGWPVTSMG